MAANQKTIFPSPRARLVIFRNSLVQARHAMDNPANKLQYDCTLIFAPEVLESPQFKRMAAEAVATIKSKWGDTPPQPLRKPFRKNEERANYEGFMPGGIFINCSTTLKPMLYDRQNQEIIDPSTVYSGCYVRAGLHCYTYDMKGNRGVSFGFSMLQKLEDASPLGFRAKPDEVFEPLEDAGTGGADGKSKDLVASLFN